MGIWHSRYAKPAPAHVGPLTAPTSSNEGAQHEEEEHNEGDDEEDDANNGPGGDGEEDAEIDDDEETRTKRNEMYEKLKSLNADELQQVVDDFETELSELATLHAATADQQVQAKIENLSTEPLESCEIAKEVQEENKRQKGGFFKGSTKKLMPKLLNFLKKVAKQEEIKALYAKYFSKKADADAASPDQGEKKKEKKEDTDKGDVTTSSASDIVTKNKDDVVGKAEKPEEKPQATTPPVGGAGPDEENKTDATPDSAQSESAEPVGKKLAAEPESAKPAAEEKDKGEPRKEESSDDKNKKLFVKNLIWLLRLHDAKKTIQRVLRSIILKPTDYPAFNKLIIAKKEELKKAGKKKR